MTTAADVERLKGQVRDLERILVREGAAEASYERQLAFALRERDEAQAAFAGAENSLTAEREHSARLSRECQERHDELRAEVEKLGKALTLETRLSLSTQRKLDEARAEVERLRKDPLPALAMLRDIERTVAEKQREACALAYMRHPDAGEDEMAELYAEVIRATPLVTEGDK